MLKQDRINRDESMATEWVVLKFGGSSVAEARHWQTIAKIVQQKIHLDLKPILVLSALKNVSNLLEALLTSSLNGEHQLALYHLKKIHFKFAQSLNIDADKILGPSFRLLEQSCETLNRTQQLTAKMQAHIVSFGEIFSSLLGHAFLSKQLRTQWIDIRSLLKPSANCHLKVKEDNWHKYVSAEFDIHYSQSEDKQLTDINAVIITQGFIASNDKNETILLGREGSDTTASYLGVLLGAQNVEIWTDVCGVFTTNPRENARARQILKLGYDEARRMANFGAKILHPRALKPLAEKNIPLSVHGMDSYLQRGTEISKDSINNFTIYAVVNEKHIHLLSFPKQLLNKINLKIDALYNKGFDRIFDSEAKEYNGFLLKYSNSTVAIPEHTEIQSLFGYDTVNFESGYGLVTLIGKSLLEDNMQQHWSSEVLDYVKNENDLKFICSYSFETVGRLSFLVGISDLKLWNEKLHKKYIENQFSLHPTDYGDCWKQN